MTVQTHENEMQSLSEQKDYQIAMVSQLNTDQSEKIKELTDEINGLLAKVSALEAEKIDYQKRLEPYKGLSEAEAQLRQVQIEKTLAQEQAAKEKAARLIEEKAVADRLKQDKAEDAKYRDIGFRPTSVECSWQDIVDDGRDFYTPKLNIKLKNISSSPVTDVALKVVFIDPENNEVFSDVTAIFLQSPSDSPLAVGYTKEAIVSGDKGYRSRPTSVPNLRADVSVIFNYSATFVQDSTFYSGPRTSTYQLLSIAVKPGNQN